MAIRPTASTALVCVVGVGLVVAGFVIGCGNLPSVNAPSAAAAGTGTLRMLITDKPFPFELIDEAVVTIERIDVRCDDEEDDAVDDTSIDEQTFGTMQEVTEESEDEGVDDANEDETTEDASADEAEVDGTDGCPWITVYGDGPDDEPMEFDLTNLRNGRSDLMALADIPAGRYKQVRLIVTEGRIVVSDGDQQREFVLRVPSGAQTGIKLHFDFEVGEGDDTTLLLDVDLSRAFKPIPGGKVKTLDDIREFKFQPSIAMRLINLIEAGSITGTVTDGDNQPLENVAVTAVQGGEDVTSTSTDADGTYALVGLLPGTYTVEFSADGYVDDSVADVEVQAGTTTENVDAMLAAEVP